ncbi:RHS repeat domain-containing protein [Streptomyces sp. MAR4 CNY-716]
MLAGLLLTSFLGGPVAAAAELSLPGLQETKPVPVDEVERKALKRTDETAGHARKTLPDGAWPKAGTDEAALPTTGDDTADLKAGSVPLSLKSLSGDRGPRRVQAQVLDRSATQALGVDGVAVALRGASGEDGSSVRLELDYGSFAQRFGGAWASRLTLRQIPACALLTPGKAGCSPRGKLVVSSNAPKAGTLSARTELDAAPHLTGAPVTPAAAAQRSATGYTAGEGTVLLALTAAASGASGDFSATPLSPSGKWSAGGSSGGFSWSYDLDVPEIAGDLQPDLALEYSSQSVDGRTAATNNQANWAGDGWTMSAGAVERRFVACEDDRSGGNNPSSKVGDLCWKTDNATLSLNGQTHELVKDDGSGEWRFKDDDGTRVELMTSANRANGDNNNEYWRVTAPDGVRYYFGTHRLPGWKDGDTTTQSVWTVPVFGNHSGEPCHATAFKDSWCQQAWRWNLDYVIDPHGQALTYYWGKEHNHYGLNVNDATGKATYTRFNRGGHLERIDYGLDGDALYAANGAQARVDFTVSERCLPTDTFDCAADKLNTANAKHWPDVPYDQLCGSGQECKTYSPSFFSRKRLTGVTTKVRVDGAYKPVDSWKLDHSFPTTGDGSDPALWLKSIQRTGHTGGSDISLPAVTFSGQMLKNRVEKAVDAVPPLNRYRVYGIKTETGSTIGVTYSPEDCTAGSLPDPATNTKRCYPVYWSPPDAPAPDFEPYRDWFHTYVATQVLESDDVGGGPVKTTSYEYLDGLAWAKDTDELTKAKHRTYSERRGYSRVRTRVGAGSETKSLAETRYFRGIDGANVADSEGNNVTDREAFAGMVREEIGYGRDGGSIIEATAYTPWRSAATATHARDGLPDQSAHYTGVKTEGTRELKKDGTWRRTSTEATFDSYGMVKTASETGDTSKPGDERCTTTSYARATGANIIETIAEGKTVATTCDATPTLPKDLVSLKRTYYDGSTTLGQGPTKGNITRVDEQDKAGTGTQTVTTATFDTHGRPLTQTDARDKTTTTAYTPATGAAPTKTVVTNPLGHTQTTVLDARRGIPTTTIDPAGARTDADYDALGRLVKVWQPGWAKADYPSAPSVQYSYTVSKTAPAAIATRTIQPDGTYTTAYTLYDGLLRERETQTPAPGGGRVITETLYDTRGLETKTYHAYHANGDPSASLVKAADNTVPNMTENIHDGSGRVTAAIARKFGDETKRTTSSYSADQTTVIPPDGGTATTDLTDARGNTVERRQYTNAARTTHQTTAYTYDKHDQLAKMTDPAGNVWTWTRDARGNVTEAKDPDKGTSTTTYNTADQPATVTDARGITLTTSYDDIGRPTAVKKGDQLRAEWVYDTLARGQLTSTTRIHDGNRYTTAVEDYNARIQPTATTISVPDAPGALAGIYRIGYTYDPETGKRTSISQPGVGGLPSERTATEYNSLGLPTTTSSGGVALVSQVSYDSFARPVRTEYGSGDRKLYRTHEYDEHTGDLTRQVTDRTTAPQRLDDVRYTRDDAGNITSQTTTSGQDAQQTTDHQCYATDALRRLTDAWTTTADTCANEPAPASVGGGPEAYWHSYTYDAIGNRTTETQHAVAGTATDQDVTRTYTQPDPGQPRPHSTTKVTTTSGTANGTSETLDYDATGNMTTRSGGTADHTYTWDDEGHLATATEAGTTTDYVYDTDGNRLLAKASDNTATLYLPEGNELRLNADGSVTGTRYYAHDGETVAVRTPGSPMHFLVSDHQGTAMLAVSLAAGQAIIRRKQLPFGAPRPTTSAGTEPDFPGTKGFVGGTLDDTGLTHIGAREYDPTLGAFISPDPLLDPANPLQANAYAYANNTPVTASDPTGEMLYDEVTKHGYGNNKVRKSWYRKQGYTNSRGHVTYKYRALVRHNTRSFNSYWAQTRAQQARAQEERYRLDSMKRDQLLAAAKAKAEWRKKENNKSSILGGIGGALKGGVNMIGDGLKAGWNFTKDHWRGMTEVSVFTVCVLASAGWCMGAGAVYWVSTNAADLSNDEWSAQNAILTAVWTVGGGMVSRQLAGSWRGGAIGRGPAGPRPPLWRGDKRPKGTPGVVNWQMTGNNAVTNGGLAWGTCSAGSVSAPLC